MALGRFITFCVNGAASFAVVTLLGLSAFGQSRVTLRADDEVYSILAMEGAKPVVEVSGKRQILTKGQLMVEAAGGYASGSVLVLKKDAVMGTDYGSGGHFFSFSATVESARDYEDCFIVLVVRPDNGSESVIIREIQNLTLAGNNEIRITVPINPGFGGAQFGFALYAGGNEIEVIDNLDNSSIRTRDSGTVAEKPSTLKSEFPITETEKVAPKPSSQKAPVAKKASEEQPFEEIEPVKLKKAPIPQFPDRLKGMNLTGDAELLYTICENGHPTSILEVSANNTEFLREALRIIHASVYEPARFDGKPISCVAYQRFSFNEFASFAGGPNMVKYPNLGDRPPDVVHLPKPSDLTGPAEELDQFTALLEVTVDEMGRAKDPRILETNTPKLAEQLLHKTEEWVFRPAIEGGVAVVSKVRVPLLMSKD